MKAWRVQWWGCTDKSTSDEKGTTCIMKLWSKTLTDVGERSFDILSIGDKLDLKIDQILFSSIYSHFLAGG